MARGKLGTPRQEIAVNDILEALQLAGGNIAKASRLLRVNTYHLQRNIARRGIVVNKTDYSQARAKFDRGRLEELLVAGTPHRDIIAELDCCGTTVLKAKKRLGLVKKYMRHQSYGEIHSSYWGNFVRHNGHEPSLLTIEQAHAKWLTQDRRCAYTGKLLVLPKSELELSLGLWTASIDRIDSMLGHTDANTQWVDKTVQRMKNMYSHEEWIQTCNDVARKHPRASREQQ